MTSDLFDIRGKRAVVTGRWLGHRHDDRLRLRRRRRERDHRLAQGGLAQGGGRRAVASAASARTSWPTCPRRTAAARSGGRGRAVGQPRHPREQRRRQLGRAAGRAGLEVVAPRARRERGGRVPRHQVPAAAPAAGRHRRGAGARDQHRFGRRHPGARLRDLRLLRVEGGRAPAHPPPRQAPGAHDHRERHRARPVPVADDAGHPRGGRRRHGQDDAAQAHRPTRRTWPARPSSCRRRPAPS